MRAKRRLDLAGLAPVLDPEHDLEAVVRREVLAGRQQVLDEVGIEVALAKRRRIAVVEQLLEAGDPDIDTRLAIFEPVA
ncbi:MAG: hypothetical protein E6J91_46255 [Deltaproteobacteria bacterium]|nr:MAG: hypothetical protein E6J91_46255 [Deltaproteobacteria bacterium]